MALSNDLISAFAKLTNNKVEDTGASVKGTFRTINGKDYVQLDGSEILTPVTKSVDAVTDERVMVLIKDHMATVTENITSPAARSTDVNDLKDEVDEFGNTIQQMDNTIIQQGNSIIQMNNTINQQGVTINQHDTLINQQGDTIVSLENTIVMQGNSISQMNNTIIQQGDSINSMNNTIIEHGNNITSIGNIVSEQGNTITQLGNSVTQIGNQVTQINNIVDEQNNTIIGLGNQIVEIDNAVQSHDNIIRQQGDQITSMDNIITLQGNDITILNSGFQIIDGVLTGLSEAIIDSLVTNNLDAIYAEIDFANIEIAAVEKLFTESGIIKDLVVQEGHITGELVGVTIKGDLIEGNTVKADKLVILGEDGIYYKLNVSAETVEAEQTEENSLSGTIITAKSITASKITVDDLVAFGATIAGFIINDYSIHSEEKGSIDSNAQGLYMDKDGQFYIGDLNNHVRYYKDENGEYILDVRASRLYFGTGSDTIEDVVDTINNSIGQNNNSIANINQDLSNTKASLELTNSTLTTKIETTNDALGQTKADLEAMNVLSEDRYNETVSALSETQQTINQISNIFQLTGGNNLIKNSVWYYKTAGYPNDWIVASGTIYDGGQDDDLIGLSVSRGKIKIRNGSAQTANTNIVNVLVNRQVALNFKYKNGLNVVSKIELFAGIDTSVDPIWSMDIAENTNNAWIPAQVIITSTQTSYIIKLTSNTSTGTASFEITDLMFNYGEAKPWELGSGEVFGATIKLNNQGVQVTAETANTENYMTTDGINVFNKQTMEKVTALTDSGLDTKNANIRETIKHKKMVNTVIPNASGIDVYVEYIED